MDDHQRQIQLIILILLSFFVLMAVTFDSSAEGLYRSRHLTIEKPWAHAPVFIYEEVFSYEWDGRIWTMVLGTDLREARGISFLTDVAVTQPISYVQVTLGMRHRWAEQPTLYLTASQIW